MSYYGPEPGPAADPWEHSAPVGYDMDVTFQPAAKEPAGSKVLLAVLVIVLVVVLCGGGVAGLYLLGRTTRTGAGPSPTPTVTVDPNTIVAGQCMVNDGTEDHPKIQIVRCDTHGSYKVLSKISGTSDKNRCQSVAGANRVYYYDAPDPANSFVLCLQVVS